MALAANGVTCKIDERWSRIFVDLDSEAGITVLTRVFGVGSVSPVEHTCDSDLESMKAALQEHYVDDVKDKSFCVRVKRSGVKGYTSQSAEFELGSSIGEHCRKVDLVNPEVKIEIEATTHGAFIFRNRIPGPGGLPLGTQGKALCLISGGFDSAVAAWRLMKRGVSLDYVFCNIAGAAYERSVLTVVKGLCDQWAYGTKPKVHILDFHPVVKAIDEHVNPHYSQVVLKRQFYRFSCRAAGLSKAHALVTGEAIGQVSSQTLSNLTAIDTASDKLILRPLIGFDKEEILVQARKIGTYILSQHIQEYCALNNKGPVTSTTIAKLDEEEAKLPDDLMEKVERKTIKVANLEHKELMTQYLFTDKVEKDAMVIDTREKFQFKAWHYPESMHLPIPMLMAAFKKFDKTKKYVLVCQYGLQTAVVAEQMQKLGFEAYSFERGANGLKKKIEAASN